MLRRSLSKISRQFSKSESLRDVIMHNDGVDDDAGNTVAEIKRPKDPTIQYN